MPVTASCPRCKSARQVELTRPEHGGRMLPIASETERSKTYVGETAEACECGERRVVIRYEHGAG